MAQQIQVLLAADLTAVREERAVRAGLSGTRPGSAWRALRGCRPARGRRAARAGMDAGHR
jgi:hypothetical protein